MRGEWREYSLGRVTFKINSGATPKGGKNSYKAEGIPLIRSMNVHDGRFKNAKLARIDREQADKLSNAIVSQNDVLLNITGASIARCCLVPDELVPARVNQHVTIIRPDPSILDSRFLTYLLTSKKHKDNLLHAGESGSTRQALTKGFLNGYKVALPALPEQKRIVAILDEAFAGIDTAIANTEKNIANARELFESYLNSVFTGQGDGWRDVAIGDIAQVKGGKRVPKGYKLQTEPTKHPYISVSDFNDSGSVDLEKIKFISEEVYQQISRYTISSEDLYISIAGTIGKSGVIPKELEGANLTENACKLVLEKDISNRYLYFFTRTESFKEQALKNTRTAAQPKLALERLKTIRLSIPPFEIQEKFVAQFNDLWSQSQDLESIYQQKLIALAELKQSLLQKAFSGELTADAAEAVDTVEAALA